MMIFVAHLRHSKSKGCWLKLAKLWLVFLACNLIVRKPIGYNKK